MLGGCKLASLSGRGSTHMHLETPPVGTDPETHLQRQTCAQGHGGQPAWWQAGVIARCRDQCWKGCRGTGQLNGLEVSPQKILTEGKMAAFQCGNDATSVRGSKWSPLVIQYIGPPDQAPRRTLVTSVLFLIGIRRVSLRMIQCQTRAEVHARPSLRTCHGLGPVRRCEDRRHGGPCVGSRRDGPCT